MAIEIIVAAYKGKPLLFFPTSGMLAHATLIAAMVGVA
jgi:hypothetical protein